MISQSLCNIKAYIGIYHLNPYTAAMEKEAAAITGFTSAIAAFGAFFIPKSFGLSISATGGASAALIAFLAFYVSCLAITWFVYVRRGGLLFDVENKALAASSAKIAAE